MELSPILNNWDLVSVGIVIILTVLLGSAVYYENSKSVTHRTFFFFALCTALWGTLNYLSYQVFTPELGLLMLRLTIFTVTWQTLFFLRFAYLFPSETKRFSKWISGILWGIALIVSLLTLTPLVFNSIGSLSASGNIARINNGPAISLFGMTTVGFALAGVIISLIKSFRKKSSTEKSYGLITVGLVLMFGAIIISNFILPVVFNNSNYLRFGALFVFPFLALTSYAIIRGKVFNVRIIGAELFIALLLLLSLVQLAQARNIVEILLRGAIFICVVGIGILLIRSVLREVRQREELEKLSQELKASNEKLKVADRMKTQFVSFASHQVKSPMTVVKDYAELIRDGTYGAIPDKVKETVEKIREAATRLIDLVGNLLDLRQLEEGKIEYKFEKIDISVLLKKIIEEMKTTASAKNLEIVLQSPTDPIMINADEQKIHQVISNLIDNAIKYTENGKINVELRMTNNECRIQVSDTGMGIPADLLPKLFEQFERGSQEAKKIQGTGLGLYIAKQFIQAHKGKIWAESDGTGKGSRFIVELPIA